MSTRRLARPGHCGTAGVNADCQVDDAGSWVFDRSEASSWQEAAEACVRRCNSCERCRYVSYSLRRQDCSWFEHCNLEKLPNFVSGFRTLAVAPSRVLPPTANPVGPPHIVRLPSDMSSGLWRGTACERFEVYDFPSGFELFAQRRGIVEVGKWSACNASSACSGFTFESAEAMPKTKVKIYFKNASNANTDSAWHAYLKGDQPAGRMVSSGSGGKPALGWRSTTGQAVITGNDPFALKISKVKTYASSTFPYQGRYPCGSLFYQGNWWYGTYYLVLQ